MVVMCRCSSVMRRPSLHEKEKDAMSAKDARDEALHVLEMMAAANTKDEDDDDEEDQGVQVQAAETEKVSFTSCSYVLDAAAYPYCYPFAHPVHLAAEKK